MTGKSGFSPAILAAAIAMLLFAIMLPQASAAVPQIAWVSPTPDPGDTTTNNWVYLNTTITADPNTSAWFDWNGSLVAYWAMDYYNSTGISDNSTHSAFATFRGGQSQGNIATGVKGNALNFNGSYFLTTSGSLVSTTAYTKAAWVYRKGGNVRNNIMSGGGAADGHALWAPHDWCPNTTTPTPFLISAGHTTAGHSDNWCSVYSRNPMPLNTWVHVAVTYDSATSTMKLYVNGTLESTNTSVDTFTNSTVQIGAFYSANFLNGTMDEAMIFSRALSAEEILALYNSTANRLYRNFTGLSNGTYGYRAYAMDASGNLNITDEREVTYDSGYQEPGSSGYTTTLSVTLGGATASGAGFLSFLYSLFVGGSTSSSNYQTTVGQFFNAGEDSGPYSTEVSDNITAAGYENQTALVSVYWHDDRSLHTAILRTNGTGSWSNVSSCALSGKDQYCNMTIDLSSYARRTLCWNQWANDTSGKLNASMSQQCFNVYAMNDLTSCNTISAPGVYMLAQNVSSVGTCFTVSADNVTLDCGGHSINYSIGGEASTYGILSNKFNTTVKNCNVLDGNWTSGITTRYGILFTTNDNSTLFNNFVNTSNSNAILIDEADFNNLTSNRGVSNSSNGFYISSSSNGTLTDNTGTSNSGTGFILTSSSNNTLTSNTGTSDSYMGIYLVYSSNNNVLISNRGTCNSLPGIYIASNSNENILTNNTGTSDTNFGIYITSSSNNALTSNTGISNSSVGLYIQSSSDNTVINQIANSLLAGDYTLYIRSSNGTIFRDCINISGVTGDVSITPDSGSINNTFINCSYDTESVEGASNYIIRKWYFDANVTYLNGTGLQSANLTAYNYSSIPAYSRLTDASGNIDRTTLTDYINTGGTRAYHTPHTVNTTKALFTTNSTSYNLTARTNVFATIVLGFNSAPSKVNLYAPANGSSTTNRSLALSWYNATDADANPLSYVLNITCGYAGGGTDCSDDNHQVTVTSGNCSAFCNYSIPYELRYFGDDNYYYNWTVRAYDGMLYGQWSDTWNFTVNTNVVITLYNSSVDFGTIHPGQTYDTTGNVPNPFRIRNDGNCYVDVNISATDLLWDTVPAPSAYYRYMIGNVTGEEGSLNWSSQNTTTSWAPVPSVNGSAIADLNYSDARDSAEIEIEITVPTGEIGGIKSSTLWFTAGYNGD